MSWRTFWDWLRGKKLEAETTQAVNNIQQQFERKFGLVYREMRNMRPADQLQYLEDRLGCKIRAAQYGGGLIAVNVIRRGIVLQGIGPTVPAAIADIVRKVK